MDSAVLLQFAGLAAIAFCGFETYSAAAGHGVLVRKTMAESGRGWYRRVKPHQAPFRYWLVVIGNLFGMGFGVALLAGLIG